MALDDTAAALEAKRSWWRATRILIVAILAASFALAVLLSIQHGWMVPLSG